MSDSGEQERSDEEPFEESRVVSTGNGDPTKAENSFPRARKIPSRQIQLLSESLATDGGLIAIADVSEAMRDAGLELGYRVRVPHHAWPRTRPQKRSNLHQWPGIH